MLQLLVTVVVLARIRNIHIYTRGGSGERLLKRDGASCIIITRTTPPTRREPSLEASQRCARVYRILLLLLLYAHIYDGVHDDDNTVGCIMIIYYKLLCLHDTAPLDSVAIRLRNNILFIRFLVHVFAAAILTSSELVYTCTRTQ